MLWCARCEQCLDNCRGVTMDMLAQISCEAILIDSLAELIADTMLEVLGLCSINVYLTVHSITAWTSSLYLSVFLSVCLSNQGHMQYFRVILKGILSSHLSPVGMGPFTSRTIQRDDGVFIGTCVQYTVHALSWVLLQSPTDKISLD